MNRLEAIEKEQVKADLPRFGPGDTVRVHSKIVEGDKERIQVFQGTVIKVHRGTNRGTFTVRKVSYGVGVERIFPIHSPAVDRIEVVSHGHVRRARLYYLRGRRGKAARVRERQIPLQQPRQAQPPTSQEPRPLEA